MKPKTQTIILPDGFRVAVTTVGHPDDIPLVFLHGLTVSAKAYEELLIDLSDHGFFVVAPDAPNHGGSGSLPMGHSVSDMADKVASALSALDIAHPVVVGHSMGGAIAAELSMLIDAQAVVLLDAATGQEHHAGINLAPYPTLVARGVGKLSGAVVDVVGDAYTSWAMRSTREWVSFVRTLKDGLSGFRWLRAANALLYADSGPALEKLRANQVPTVVIHGELDQIVPLESGISSARAAEAELYVIENGFHSWVLAEPAFAAGVIDSALAKVGV